MPERVQAVRSKSEGADLIETAPKVKNISLFCLWLCIFVLFFQPGIVFPSMQSISPVKMATLVAIIAYIFMNKQKSRTKFWTLPSTRYFLFFIGIQTVSAGALWLHGALDRMFFWGTYLVVTFLITKTCVNENSVKMLIKAVPLGLIYLSVFSLWSLGERGTGLSGRAEGFGWYENPNDLALILVSTVPILFLLSEESASKVAGAFWLLLLFMFGANILLTGSRGGLLGLVVVGYLSITSMRKMHQFVKRFVLFGFLGLAIVVGVMNITSRPGVSGLRGDQSSEDRILQWKACIRMLVEHPLLGIGPNEAVSQMESYGGIRGLPPHNTVLQVFAETGVPGGIVFLLFGFQPLFDLLKAGRYPPSIVGSQEFRLYKKIGFALIGYWICAFFSNRVESHILYVLVSFMASLKTLALERIRIS